MCRFCTGLLGLLKGLVRCLFCLRSGFRLCLLHRGCLLHGRVCLQSAGIIVLIFRAVVLVFDVIARVSVITCTRYIRLQGCLCCQLLIAGSIFSGCRLTCRRRGGLFCLFCQCCSGIRMFCGGFCRVGVFRLCERRLCPVVAGSFFSGCCLCGRGRRLRGICRRCERGGLCGCPIRVVVSDIFGLFHLLLNVLPVLRHCHRDGLMPFLRGSSRAGGVRNNVRWLCVVSGGCRSVMGSDVFRLCHLFPGRHRLMINVTGE